MDVDLAIASKRDVKTYDGRPVPPEAVDRILDGGRLSGSARNRQPWQFLVIESAEVRARLAEAVYAPGNVLTAALVVAVVSPGKGAGFDCGRAAQNMMLAAWNEGIGSSPNGVAERELAREALGLEADLDVVIVLSFGYPAAGRRPEERSAADWSARANRRALDEVVDRL